MHRLFSSGSSLAHFSHLSLAAAGNLLSQPIMFSLPDLILNVSWKRIFTVAVTGCRIPNGKNAENGWQHLSLRFHVRVVIWSVSNWQFQFTLSVLFTGRSSKSRLRLGLDHSLAGMADIRFFDDKIHLLRGKPPIAMTWLRFLKTWWPVRRCRMSLEDYQHKFFWD